MDRKQLINNLATDIIGISIDHPVRVAIDGVDAAGKTFLADELAGNLKKHDRQVIRASVDGFHNPTQKRVARGALSPEGYYLDSFNYIGLMKYLLEPLGPGGDLVFRRSIYDYKSDSYVYSPIEEADPDSILIFDGVFLLRPEIRDYWDYSIFLMVSIETSLERAIDRDIGLFGSEEMVLNRYQSRYIPGQRIYLSQANPEQWATKVIDNNNHALPKLIRNS
jgi:uridine kinase